MSVVSKQEAREKRRQSRETPSYRSSQPQDVAASATMRFIVAEAATSCLFRNTSKCYEFMLYVLFVKSRGVELTGWKKYTSEKPDCCTIT